MPAQNAPLESLGGLAFRVAVGFLVVTTMLGALLRFLALRPLRGWEYGHLLHTHSHLGFLGWVFNAFLALALMRFVPAEQLLGAGLLPFVPGDLVKSSLSARAFPATGSLVNKMRGGRS